ncbi:MAG: energy-coupling factor transporter transmembrane protein EcfT [Treponema sp.]|jgi:biotin transport system permease protein/energy-coupling factor transport system permease protein|nr:energy-coupling factor transporter transmembrane protein EcfT [Treponema sp.]
MALNMERAAFRYKTVRGPLHRIPALLKLFLLLPLSLFCLSPPSPFLAAGIAAAIITASLCGFTLREQITDLKPAAFYAALMYALSAFSILLENARARQPSVLTQAFIPKPEFLSVSLRLALVAQLSSLLFRSTSPIELRESIASIERFLCRRLFRVPPRYKFSSALSLFLCFIPEVFENWTAINLAWKARGGKGGFRKIKTLCFIIITLSLEKAALKAKALAAKGG